MTAAPDHDSQQGLLTDVGAFAVSDPATGRVLPTLAGANQPQDAHRGRFGPLSINTGHQQGDERHSE